MKIQNNLLNMPMLTPLTIQESEFSKREYDSSHQLQKIFKTALEPTNWRLMSEGVSYRLGILSGRLKGYEREDELMDIVR